MTGTTDGLTAQDRDTLEVGIVVGDGEEGLYLFFLRSSVCIY